MDALEDEVALAVDHVGLATGIASPEHIDQMLALACKGLDGGVGEVAPAQHGVAVGLVGPHRERGVEQQHALARPALQVAAGGHGSAHVLLYLLEDVLQRGREGHAVLHREAQAVSLAGLVVGVLADDDHLHLVEGAQVEGIEDEAARRIAGSSGVFLSHAFGQLCEIGFLKLALQVLLPCGLYLYVHE